ncbi:hypothetical protein E5720_16715 [Rhodococcus sp. PAMC28707]|uniref:hypothetical protein n=1 Tax=unclassified Rhodococcus (in: high G+C Gram-positive bacteria) TaxID=192944 RepID=UPI00109DC3B0|nr:MULTISPECIES: hypothetical protein [unclassified Rhodococcus (in: high G+C Gram-positive bacteria)]QCB51939.1 hypothetical protein E5769_18805 [Rhodococcus sp. PAMC28705]QCB59891.1 hypothetical protein E5720_16715 [Rhodococcus sp. PAMC28707]
MDIFLDDPSLAAQLRKSVELLADNAPDPAMGEILKQVLDGEKSLRDVVAATDFSEMFRPYAESAVTDAAHMTDDEKETMAKQGRLQVDAEYEAQVRATSGRPASVPEDSVDYFRNRGSIMESGW